MEGMATKSIIRLAQPDDLDSIVKLCEAHARFEKSSYVTEGKKERLKQYLFNEKPVLICWVVETAELLVGYATFMKQFSTWDGCFYIYLDCLYLQPSARNKGLGHEIMDRLSVYASAEGCDTIQWQTPSDNLPAIRFYQKLGGNHLSKERFVWKHNKGSR